MLTIRQQGTSVDRVIEATDVSFDEKTGVLTARGTPEGDVEITGGHVFVMNMNGKTVASFNLRRQQK